MKLNLTDLDIGKLFVDAAFQKMEEMGLREAPSTGPAEEHAIIGGRRVASTGAIFKRELKTTDSFQSITDLVVSPKFTDVYDGQATFLGPMETEETLETGEITFGSHYTNSEYIIESPVKRAPNFGGGDLIGLDLNIFHDNVAYDKHITVPDVEIYKFKTSLESAKTEGTFGVPTAAKANVIVGSMSYKGANTSSITESFDGASIFTGSLARGNQKRGINSKEINDGDAYLLLDDAWAIQEGDKGNHTSRDRSQGISKKSSFRKQHCVEYQGQWILPLKKGYGSKLEASEGRRRFLGDFAIQRHYYDKAYCESQEINLSFLIEDLLKFKNDKFANLEETNLTSKVLQSSVINTTDTFLDNIRYTNYIQNGTSDDGSPKISAYSLPVFSDFNTPKTGTCMQMSSLYPASQAHQDLTFGKAKIDYQSILAVMKLPKPLTLARIQDEDEPMDSMEVSISFSIPRLDTYHRSDIGTSQPTGHNLNRSFGVFCATRPMNNSEDLSGMLKRMNTGPSVDFRNRASKAEGRNLKVNSYNGLFFIRHTTTSDNTNAATGEIKIIPTGNTRGSYNVHGELSSGAPAGPAYIVKDGAQGGGTITAGVIEPNILKTIGTDGEPNTNFETSTWYTLKIHINHRDATDGYMRWTLLNSDGQIMFTERQKHQGIANFTDATCDLTTGGSATTVTHNTNANIIAGLGVSGTGIPEGATIESTPTANTFVLSKAATIAGTNVTLTFGAPDVSNTGDQFPAYLHFVVNGCKVGADGEVLDDANPYGSAVDSQTDVCIETIAIRGFEGDMYNSSISPKNLNPSPMRISGTSEFDLIDDSGGTFTIGEDLLGDDTRYTHNTSVTDVAVVPSYLYWGTKDDIWSSKTNHFFMGEFDTANYVENDASAASKSIKFTTTSSSANTESDVIFFIPDDSTNNDLGMWLTQDRDQNLGVDHHLNDKVTLTGANFCDKFTKPGFWTLTNSGALSDEVGGNYVARENPACSTKITSILSASRGQVTVANPSILKQFSDDKFIIYRAGRPYDNRFFRDDYVLEDTTIFGGDNGNTFTFSKREGAHGGKADDGSTPLIHLDNLSELYVSPLRYWIVAEIYNKAETGNALLADKTYGYSVVTLGTGDTAVAPASTTKGTTFSETLYSDSSELSNKWSLSFSSAGGLVEDSIDFGYGKAGDEQGALDGETSLGYIQKYSPVSGYNTVSLDSLIQVENTRLKKPDEKVSLYLKVSPELRGVSSLTTTKYTGDSRDPFFTFYYVDKLPVVESFQISPNKDDPFYADFKWSAKDDDLWYGFLMISNTEIKHQYHDAVAVIHLNETDVSSASNIKLKRYSGIHNGTEVDAAAIGGGMATSREGLAGNALLTDAGEDCFVTFPDAVTNDSNSGGYTQPTDEFSLVAHFTCDSIAHTGFVVGKHGEFDISVDTSGNVNAAITPQGGTEVTLKSTSVINTDGETPTNVILTFDGSLISGNVKLFVNGKLEDQSGLKTTAGSADNWKVGTNLANAASRLTVGIEPVTGTSLPSSTERSAITAVSTTIADYASTASNNNYVLLSDSSAQKYLVWFDHDGNGVKPAGISEDFQQEIDLSAVSANVNDIAAAISLQLAANSDFAAAFTISNSTASAVFVDKEHGTATDIVRGAGYTDSDLTVTTTVQGAGTNGFSGKIEEIVLYNKAIYPVVPKTGNFTFTKPLEELSSASVATGISNVARLFIKDYHNIRGTSSTEVASSSNVAFKKAGLGLKTN